jgi:hypothetical protein
MTYRLKYPLRRSREMAMEMDRPPSIRWMRAGVGMLWAGVAMFASALATGMAHGSLAIVVLFIVLMVLCGLVALWPSFSSSSVPARAAQKPADTGSGSGSRSTYTNRARWSGDNGHLPHSRQPVAAAFPLNGTFEWQRTPPMAPSRGIPGRRAAERTGATSKTRSAAAPHPRLSSTPPPGVYD